MIVAEVDLMTHSRWIREKDPLNIYRYPQWLYRLFYFRGQPNRVRPSRYREAFQRLGWNVNITPVSKAKTVPSSLRNIDCPDYLTILIEGSAGRS